MALRGAERPGTWTWVGIGCYVVVSLLMFRLAWPVAVTFENDGAVLLTDYVDDSATLDEMRRDLTDHMARHYAVNKRHLDQLFVHYQLMIVALGAEIVSLLVDLHGRA